MGPSSADELGSSGFETFVECVFEPLLVGGGLGDVADSGDAGADVVAGVAGVDDGDSNDFDANDVDGADVGADATTVAGIEYKVERVKAVRVRNGIKEYLVKWLGYPNRNNVWRVESDLKCDSLVADFESGRDKSKVMARRRSERLKAKPFYGLLAALVTLSAVAPPSWGLITLPGEDAEAAIRYMHSKQGLDGDPLEYVAGYNAEIDHMLRRRLRRISDSGKLRTLGSIMQ
jgi:hypothetical protein